MRLETSVLMKDGFEQTIKRCDHQYGFEWRGSDHVLVPRRHTHPQLGVRVSVTMPDDEEAKRAIMLQSFDGRFKTFRALPYGAFAKYQRKTLAFAGSDIGFDEQQPIKDREPAASSRRGN